MRLGEGFIEAVVWLVMTNRMNESLGSCGRRHPPVPFITYSCTVIMLLRFPTINLQTWLFEFELCDTKKEKKRKTDGS